MHGTGIEDKTGVEIEADIEVEIGVDVEVEGGNEAGFDAEAETEGGVGVETELLELLERRVGEAAAPDRGLEIGEVQSIGARGYYK